MFWSFFYDFLPSWSECAEEFLVSHEFWDSLQVTVEVKLGFCAIFFPFNKEATLGEGHSVWDFG